MVGAVAQQTEMGIVCLAEPCRSLRNGIEYWLQLIWGPRNDRQHLCGCCLVLQRLLQLAGTRLFGLEQPGVLDSDDGLIREGLQKRYLLWRERSNLGASQKDRPNRLPLSHQGSGQGRAVPDHQLRWFSVGKFAFEKGRYIINMHGLAVENRSSSDASTRQR